MVILLHVVLGIITPMTALTWKLKWGASILFCLASISIWYLIFLGISHGCYLQKDSLDFLTTQWLSSKKECSQKTCWNVRASQASVYSCLLGAQWPMQVTWLHPVSMWEKTTQHTKTRFIEGHQNNSMLYSVYSFHLLTTLMSYILKNKMK